VINDFLLKNWFDLLQSAFIVGGFILSFIAIRNDIRSRKVEYLLYFNQSYREMWSKTYSHPELLRIRKTDLDLKVHPITEAERRMVKEIIIHLYAIYEAIRTKHLDKGEIERDIYDFFHLPIPNTVWSEVKTYQNKQFVSYINGLLSQKKKL
jgi:hypothetical protein